MFISRALGIALKGGAVGMVNHASLDVSRGYIS